MAIGQFVFIRAAGRCRSLPPARKAAGLCRKLPNISLGQVYGYFGVLGSERLEHPTGIICAKEVNAIDHGRQKQVKGCRHQATPFKIQ